MTKEPFTDSVSDKVFNCSDRPDVKCLGCEATGDDVWVSRPFTGTRPDKFECQGCGLRWSQDEDATARDWFHFQSAPEAAVEFANRRCQRVGVCSEVVLSAYSDYQRTVKNGGVCPDCGGAGDSMMPYPCATCV